VRWLTDEAPRVIVISFSRFHFDSDMVRQERTYKKQESDSSKDNAGSITNRLRYPSTRLLSPYAKGRSDSSQTLTPKLGERGD